MVSDFFRRGLNKLHRVQLEASLDGMDSRICMCRSCQRDLACVLGALGLETML